MLIFIFQWGYYIFFEKVFNGKTLGKMIVKIRVIHYRGEFLDIKSIILRNFLRLVDQMYTGFLGSIICMAINKEYRRIGDLVGDTVVVSEKPLKQTLPNFNIHSTSIKRDHTELLTKKLSEHDLYIIRTFLKSTGKLPQGKRFEIGNKIAKSFKIKLNDKSEYSDPVEYLKIIYKKHHEN